MDIEDAKAWAVAEFQRKPNTAYHQYAKYLRGDQDLKFATKKFEEAFGKQFKEFAYNLCETVVDAHADRMEITGFGADDETLQQAAQDIWDANGMDYREGQVEADQFGLGDGYVIVDLVDNAPVIWPAVPTEMRVRYSDQKPGHRVAAARLWGEGKLWRLNVWTETLLAKYQAPRPEGSTDAPKEAKTFVPLVGQEDPIANPVPGIVPVFHFANNGRVNDYGVSELRSVLPLQDGVNKTVTDMMVAMEFYAFRQRMLLGVSIDPDDTKSQEMLNNFQMGLTRIGYVDGVDGKTPQIAEFSETNIRQYIDVIERFEKKIAHVTKVPRNYFGQRGADAISGESKRMDESPFISKIEDRQRAAGQEWAEMMRYALLASGKQVEPGKLRVNWKPAAPVSKDEELQRGLAMKSIGYPFVAILREAGYEPDQITEIQGEKREEQDAARQMLDMGASLNGRAGVN